MSDQGRPIIGGRDAKPDLKFIVAMDPATAFEMEFDIFEAHLGPDGPSPGEHIVHGLISYKGDMTWDIFSGPLSFSGPNDIEQFAGCFHAIRRTAADSIVNWVGEKFLIT